MVCWKCISKKTDKYGQCYKRFFAANKKPRQSKIHPTHCGTFDYGAMKPGKYMDRIKSRIHKLKK